MRLRALKPNHVLSCDFVYDRKYDGTLRTLNILDGYTHECLADPRGDRKLNSENAIDALINLFIIRGFPGFIRFDNGPEFVAKLVRDWISAVGAKLTYIEPGSPWENRHYESFNA